MRKSTLFISAALTTFMLAVMFGVASAYQKIVQTGLPTESTSQPTNVVIGTSTSTAAGSVTIEQASALASNVIGRTDLYAAENTQLNGVDAYLVTFSSGDLVYVSLDGKIMSISKLPVTYIVNQTTSHNGGGGNNGGNNNGGNSSSVAPAGPAAAPAVAPVAPSTGSGEDHGGGEDNGGGGGD
jgi:hypothetical protein